MREFLCEFIFNLSFIPLLLAISFALYPQTANGITYNSTDPVLIKIAQCESGGRQYADDGSVIESMTHDFGIFQINRGWHKFALSKGFDIYTERGNVGFALWLYHHEGTRPWNASRQCWQGSG